MPGSRAAAPKSTLAAARKPTVPWGLSPQPVPTVATVATVSTGQARGVRSGTTTTQAARARMPLATSRSAGEQRLIALLVAAALGVTIALATLGARASMALASSEQKIGTTLGRASLQQMEFHTQNARFAIWQELASAGAVLPPNVTVVRSNATPSHWYLSLRDGSTGLTCDRVGQLIDPPADLSKPSCTRTP
jgi:hypothetical protein